MAPEPSRRAPRFATLLALLLLVPAPAHALRVATWNLLAYNAVPTNARQANFRTVMASLGPDVLITQEMNSAAAKDSFLLDVLGVVEPGQWTGQWLSLGSGEGGGIFWKPAAVTVTNITSIATGGPRNVLQTVIRPAGYTTNGAWFRLYSVHLKAGVPLATTADSTTRRVECTSLRTTLNGVNTSVVGPNFLVGGDTNFYGPWEGGYVRLTESQTSNNGRCIDPLPLPATWHANGAYAPYHTQCPCLSCITPGQSGGGMDDRFDLLMVSTAMTDTVGVALSPGGYTAYGNDGFHFNQDINAGGFNNAVPLAVANALHDASDHIPVIATLLLPARLATAPALAFGDAIVGATVTQPLAVANLVTLPGRTLYYSFAPPAGFGAPAGSFAVAAGDPAATHTLTLDTSAPGNLAGTLVLTSTDNDTTSKPIALTGRVFAHAAPSLDSLLQVTAGALDFGNRLAGTFADSSVRVFDAGFGPLQARLAVNGGGITGDPRFTLVGGFTPALLADIGQTWNVHFDDTGAALDSTYTATLTFTTADEALPGASPLAPLTVDLRARVVSAVDAVGAESFSLRFVAPHPNPLHGGTELGFELPRAARVTLGIYDLGGRRVATLADGALGEGRHTLRWNAQDDAGRPVAAGLYFVRFSTPGLARVSRVAVLP